MSKRRVSRDLMGKPSETMELSGSIDLRGRRVLVADAQSEARWAVVGALRAAGARVAEARDGLDALEVARSQPPELIVASVSMPRLDGLGLCAAIRREPSLRGVTVVLRADGEPPQAMWEPHPSSRPLVQALLVALGRARSGQRLKATAPEPSEGAELTPSEGRADSGQPMELTERENVRAQSAVAMHREPANRAPRGSGPLVWRLGGAAEAHADPGLSGFGWELQMMSRVLGLGLIALVAGVVALIAWRLASTAELASSAESAEALSVEPVVVVVPRPTELADDLAWQTGLRAFSGTLRPGVDPALGVRAGEGVIQLHGAPGLGVVVDGVDRGVLPLSLVLPAGRHSVRYELREGASVRFYFVEAGATRVLRVITRPGGFVDVH